MRFKHWPKSLKKLDRFDQADCQTGHKSPQSTDVEGIALAACLKCLLIVVLVCHLQTAIALAWSQKRTNTLSSTPSDWGGTGASI
jgi:hypothetical protein